MSGSAMPVFAQEMAANLGHDNAATIIGQFGGIRLFIPKKISQKHMLRERLGDDLAGKLSGVYGGETITVPRCAKLKREGRNREIAAAYDKGESVRSLAERYELTERQIYSILSSTVLPA